MKSFLEYVAEDILRKYGTDLSRIAVVFPNKRASLFLNEHLARLSSHPIWSPAYITISDLFRHHSDLEVADPIKLVCDLHRVFTEVTGTDETLDHFYGWGQLLIADFDDVDKNMADAEKVFANVRDIHELDDIAYLTEEQKAAIRKFFGNFSDDHNTELKERFLRLWSRMFDLYQGFNKHLAQQGLAYEGALYRQVASSSHIDFAYDTYLFVGFNVLQQVEQRLFSMLKKEGRAHFYWDFDQYYMQGQNEAGHYIALYQADFPNELDSSNKDIYGQFAETKQISFVSASTENIQARYISTWLSQQDRIKGGRSTAIVLCNEALLPTAIHALPDEVEKVNITTGYPLSQAPIASFIGQLITLRTLGYDVSRNSFRPRYVNVVKRHPYSAFISEEELFATPEGGNPELLQWLCKLIRFTAQGNETKDPLFQESVFRAYSLINRLRELVDCGDLSIDVVTLQRLIRQLISSTSIPFHGEPAEGLQVMGVLETRNLDFQHVLLLSCNEGNMPRGVNDNSFIPYSIRKAYGLTTIDHKVSIYSYYFHRLIQRAKDITILYNNATTDGQTGEMSRFMLQLLVESPHRIEIRTLQAGQHFSPVRLPVIEKSSAVMERLLRRFDVAHQEDSRLRPLLTPTAINRYMRCPLSFYYNYVCDLQEPDTTDDETIDNRLFGNIFHEASRIVYSKLKALSPNITGESIASLLKERFEIERAVDEAMHKELNNDVKRGGLAIISREVIIHYLRMLLQHDQQLTPFTIIGLECDVVAPMNISCSSHPFMTMIGGRIDRLDQIIDEQQRPHIRVIDYKTGSSRLYALPDVEAIFQQENISRHSDYYLQTMLYACLIQQSVHYNANQLPVSPALLFIQHTADDPILRFGKDPIYHVADHLDTFGQLLKEKVEEIFNPDLPFTPTPDITRCATCPYRELCLTKNAG